MSPQESIHRPGRPLRAAVVLLVLAALVGAWLLLQRARTTPSGAPGAVEVPAESAAPAQTTVQLDFTVATIPALVESRLEVASFLGAVGSAPGAQAGSETVKAWHDQLDALVSAGLASIESRPRMLVFSGDRAALRVSGRAGQSVSDLSLAATPTVVESGAVALDLRVESERAEGALQLWARDAGVAIGPSAAVESAIHVLPGGGAGLAAAVRRPLGRDGWLIVLVEPVVVPPPPPGDDGGP